MAAQFEIDATPSGLYGIAVMGSCDASSEAVAMNGPARLLRPSMQQEMEEEIAVDPDRHPVIPGTGGFRKARWRRPGGGKSDGVRVIYYFMVRPDLIFLADLRQEREGESDPCGKKRAPENRLGNPAGVRWLSPGAGPNPRSGSACSIR